jgi:hypothetical protein
MANPTTNYGFVLPSPTDLVTDLPADFDVALQGVDTRLKALQPGTTLGDLAYSSATANTNTRLGIGTTGQVLTVSGGVPTWATASSGGMTLISTTTLTGASVTLSSIPTTYKHLYMTVHDAYSAAASNFQFQMNGDTGANYSWGYVAVNGSTFAGNSTVGGTNIRATLLSNAGGSFATELIIEIPNYTDTTGVQLLQTNGYWATNRSTINAAGVYHNRSAAITSLTIFTNSTFSSGTVRLYGVN